MDVLKISLETTDTAYNLQVLINKWLVLLAAIALIAWVIYLLIRRFPVPSWKTFDLDKAELGIGTGKLTFKPNYEDQQIAYKLWIELSTRKIGLPIDFEHDVLEEIYDSWYEFFRITRELIKEIPVSKAKNRNTRPLIDTSIDVLNEGLRPHLTKWQARFRRWYDAEFAKPENELVSPQELQKKYPKYNELVNDMKDVNEKLIKYRDKLKELALG